jgi:alcohol dehydrogenase (NADP+)
MTLISKSIGVSGSAIGSPAQIERMFRLAKEHGIETYHQKYDFKDINQAFADFDEGKPRFRFVLVNTENGGEM